MTTIIIIFAAFALIAVAFLGGCLGVFKTGEKEGICKYDYENDN